MLRLSRFVIKRSWIASLPPEHAARAAREAARGILHTAGFLACNYTLLPCGGILCVPSLQVPMGALAEEIEQVRRYGGYDPLQRVH